MKRELFRREPLNKDERAAAEDILRRLLSSHDFAQTDVACADFYAQTFRVQSAVFAGIENVKINPASRRHYERQLELVRRAVQARPENQVDARIGVRRRRVGLRRED